MLSMLSRELLSLCQKLTSKTILSKHPSGPLNSRPASLPQALSVHSFKHSARYIKDIVEFRPIYLYVLLYTYIYLYPSLTTNM